MLPFGIPNASSRRLKLLHPKTIPWSFCETDWSWAFRLYRNVDLQRMRRKISFIDAQPFLFVQRKGWSRPMWEKVPVIDSAGCLCPWRCLRDYVDITRTHAPTGGPVFISLHPPFGPLSSNTLGSLTNRLLASFGLNTTFWKAHSTREAAVGMYKRLGLQSEEVCDLGRWKNLNLFFLFFYRLNTA